MVDISSITENFYIVNQWGNLNQCDDDYGQVIHVAPTHTSHPLNEVFDRIIWGYFAGLKRLGSGMILMMLADIHIEQLGFWYLGLI